MNLEKTTTVESLLGVLSFGPKTGYQMRQMMEHSTANFWSESFGQIYPALKAMLAQGLVEVTDASGEGRARRMYRITAAGEERLKHWLGVPAKPQVYRHELLLKLFFGAGAEHGVLREQVLKWQQRFGADLDRYKALQQEMETKYAGHPAMPYWRMTVRYGIAEARMVMDWCDETLAELQRVNG